MRGWSHPYFPWRILEMKSVSHGNVLIVDPDKFVRTFLANVLEHSRLKCLTQLLIQLKPEMVSKSDVFR
jgi:hypothetical protein